jgi:hypothetical protein
MMTVQRSGSHVTPVGGPRTDRPGRGGHRVPQAARPTVVTAAAYDSPAETEILPPSWYQWAGDPRVDRPYQTSPWLSEVQVLHS